MRLRPLLLGYGICNLLLADRPARSLSQVKRESRYGISV